MRADPAEPETDRTLRAYRSQKKGIDPRRSFTSPIRRRRRVRVDVRAWSGSEDNKMKLIGVLISIGEDAAVIGCFLQKLRRSLDSRSTLGFIVWRRKEKKWTQFNNSHRRGTLCVCACPRNSGVILHNFGP